MKIMLKRILRSERGQALPMALILLVLGGFLVVPTLALMTTNLTANRLVDRANLELYSADAGVEEIMWHLNYDTGFTLPTDSSEHPVTVPQVNGRTIVATISKQGEVYRITSTATGTDGHSTTIKCFVDAGSKYSFLFDNAITSAGKVTLQPGTTVNGNVVYAKDPPPDKGTINGTLTKDTTLGIRWPKATDLETFYLAQVTTTSTSDISVTGTEANPTSIGPLKVIKSTLTIKGDGYARLDGTLYVQGNLKFNPTQTGISLNLNGNTIYVTGAITSTPGLTITGSGCIVAEGDVTLAPSIGSASTDYVLLLSVTGTTWLKPSGTFYGSVAGYKEVQLQPGEIVHTTANDVNFPGMGGGAGGGLGGKAKLLTYIINPP